MFSMALGVIVPLRQFRGLRCVERVNLSNKAPRANPNDFKCVDILKCMIETK